VLRKKVKSANPYIPQRGLQAELGREHSYMQMAEAIRMRILSGRLKPGQRLPAENDLAAQYGVSRTTAREALRLLASERLIETKRGVQGGAFVIHPNDDDIDYAMKTAFGLMSMSGALTDQEILESSLLIAPMLARLAAERRTDEQAQNLFTVPWPENKANAADEQWLAAAQEFNRRMLTMINNRLLPVLIRPLIWIVPVHFRHFRSDPRFWAQTFERHMRIANAILRRDGQAAFDAMHDNILKYVGPAKPARVRGAA
jgi:DNA-binding FadR family transcriptional regulator